MTPVLADGQCRQQKSARKQFMTSVIAEDQRGRQKSCDSRPTSNKTAIPSDSVSGNANSTAEPPLNSVEDPPTTRSSKRKRINVDSYKSYFQGLSKTYNNPIAGRTWSSTTYEQNASEPSKL